MAAQPPKAAPQSPDKTHPPATPGTARDREMGRDAPPGGDLGRGRRTWAPPADEQGISNRPGDGASTDATETPGGRTSDPPSSGVPSQQGVSGHAQDERPDDEKKTRDRGGRS